MLEYAHLQLLIDGQVPEAEDLDYKRDLYGNTDKDKRSLSTDVAALASTRGGLLILGIDEDEQGRAKDFCDVALSDAEFTRMLQIIASGTAPLPTFEIIPVENPAKPGFGCYVISVAAGPRQPYAVPVSDGYRYPRRIGTTIGYLTEPEIETAYHRRDVARRDQRARADEIEQDVSYHITHDYPWVLISLVPDHPGEAPVNATTFSHVRNSYMGASPWLVSRMSNWQRVTLGQRRFVVDDQWGQVVGARAATALLYDDGAGVFAACPRFGGDESSTYDLHDELLVESILAGVLLLAEHARERANVAGHVSLRATLTPADSAVQSRLLHPRGFRDALGHPASVTSFRPATAAALVDHLVAGPELVSTAALLSTEFFQGFGLAETLQISQAGEVRLPYWSNRGPQEEIRWWAEKHGINVTDAALR
ncbi:AlbA family DNA-binding domain-containing protein [Nonomuraea recticatena]|uniref:AlbA family DNA-binding domain-containing protein n=1 Tax=Nonomuraea recticatena TaxID=46178 RepID=UPI00360B0626